MEVTSNSEGGFYFSPPEFTVDLDLPPKQRWNHIVPKYIDQLKEVISYISKAEYEEFGYFGSWVTRAASYAMSWYTYDEVHQELLGIAELTAPHGLRYNNLLALNCGYDLLARCTSMVAKDNDGFPIHLRNMDWEGEILHRLTILVRFQRSGKTLFSTTTWVGLVGILTGLRHRSSSSPEVSPHQESEMISPSTSGYSLSINFRKVNEGWSALMFHLYRQSCWPLSFLIRDVLSRAANFHDAVRLLSTTPLIAPCYIIVAGTEAGEGVIITRDRGAEKNRISLSDSSCIVQTNIDHWCDRVDPKWADGDPLLLNAIERRSVANALAMEKRFDSQSAFKLLTTPPVLNELTVYCTVMSARQSIHITQVRKAIEEERKRSLSQIAK